MTKNVTCCKDCIWWGNNWYSRLGALCTHSKMRAGAGHIFVSDDFYCAYGQTLDDGLKAGQK